MNIIAKYPRLLKIFEKFGNVENLIHKKPKVLTCSRLTRDSLSSLFDHRCIAIHVKGFYDPQFCDEIVKMINKKDLRTWSVQSDKMEEKTSF